ncbi:hypothetical protein GLUCOINTEAF2_0203144 [Komagataeibacter intermedius AF2]|uniref:Uncharacterized protein n=1 Tax=Komagataeibacter intermedius AF2 TaxID=1458464 RepID=A0A0N1FJF8_9PROT|nr:hypothetical protein [Komagataeibacter intermedius]KPH85889.1 hypothetical protein GLUCOINTEAF2_0203144 [Komagataeibacter intermedius AF2]
MNSKTDNLDKILQYFPTGTAEGERSILDKVFIYADEFKQIISPIPGSPVLLIGEKGSGKSALLDFSSRLTNSQGIPTVSLTLFDIDTSGLATNASTGDMVRAFYDILLIAVAKKISEENSGWFDGDYANLYYAAVDANARKSDFPGKIGKFIAEIAKGPTKIDLVSAFPHLTETTRSDVELSAQKIVGKKSFYLFIDDTDQISNPDDSSHLNRVWAIILASRRIAEKIPELKCIVTLRSEVWVRLQRDETGQRDQADHFRNLVVNMYGTREHIIRIVRRRLSLASNKNTEDDTIYDDFFDEKKAHAPQSSDLRTWENLITVRSRERPRDTIQLISTLAKEALKNGKNKIDQKVFIDVMPVFSKRISDQFGQETTIECPQALEILKTFASAEYDHTGFTMSAEGALEHFKKIPSKFTITLFGKTIRPGNEIQAFELWQFFYQEKVINARASDIETRDGFKHLDPENDAFLVSKARWNDLQKYLWEINTAYRDYLVFLQKEDGKYSGLAIKRPAGNRKRRNSRR